MGFPFRRAARMFGTRKRAPVPAHGITTFVITSKAAGSARAAGDFRKFLRFYQVRGCVPKTYVLKRASPRMIFDCYLLWFRVA